MSWTQILAIAVIVAFAAAVTGYTSARAAWHGHGGWTTSHGWHGAALGPGSWCGAAERGWVEGAVTDVEGRLALTPAQQKPWQGFAEAVRGAFDELCAGLDRASSPSTLPQAIAGAEEVLRVGLRGLGRLRPALDQLYARLSEEQRKTLDGLLAGGPHGGTP